jgi:ribose-phosphate pyrophosphokinase
MLTLYVGLSFSLIHKVSHMPGLGIRSSSNTAQERRPTKITDRQSASMILVGDVSERVCILIDDLIDTGNTVSFFPPHTTSSSTSLPSHTHHA